jgi:hypothetical protein
VTRKLSRSLCVFRAPLHRSCKKNIRRPKNSCGPAPRILRVQPSSESHAVGPRKTNKTLQHSCVSARGRCVCSPESHGRPSNAKNIRRSNIHAVRPAALRVCGQPISTSRPSKTNGRLQHYVAPVELRVFSQSESHVGLPTQINMRRSNIHAVRGAARDQPRLNSTQSAQTQKR